MKDGTMRYRTPTRDDAPAPFAVIDGFRDRPGLSPLTFWAGSRRASKVRRRVEMQGFTGLDDQCVTAIAPWLRLSPAICMVWAGVATTLGSAALLAALVPFALAGALGRVHPFDMIYQRGLRHVRGTPAIPDYGAPRRFACLMASAWLAATALAFQAGYVTAGRVLGYALVAVAAVPVTTGFCVPSWIYGQVTARLARRRDRRDQRRVERRLARSA